MRILHCIKRFSRRFACAQVFARLVFRLLFLNMAAIRQHNAGQLRCSVRCDNAALESLFNKQRDKAGMVNVRVR